MNGMNKHLKIFSILLLIFCLLTPPACAVPYEEEEEESNLPTQITYAVTIIIGVFLALVLVGIARQTSEVKGRLSEIKKFQNISMEPDILREIENLGGSSKRQKEAALVISSLLQEKVNAKVDSAARELSAQYTKIVEEKTQEALMVQQKYEKTLGEKKQTEAIVRSVAEGVVVVNDKGEVLLMNPAAERLLDVKREEKIGRSLLEGAKEGQLFSLAKETTEGERNIELNSTEDETKKILRSSSAVIEDENGKTVGMVTVLSDITKQKELEQMKSDFVSSVSHELRNPIGAIQQSLAVILNGTAGPLTEHQEKFLSNAQRNLKRLSTLIDDLLDLAKLEARKMELKYALTSLEDIVNEVLETMNTWAKNKNIRFTKNLKADLPKINIDPDRIIQVLVNLVSNAIKFTPEGGQITIEAGLTGTGQVMEIGVADTGIGIAEEDLSKLFNKFQQVGRKKPAEMSGTGLGLAIAKEIVHLHGGEIRVESELNQGTKFIFTLPIQNNV